LEPDGRAEPISFGQPNGLTNTGATFQPKYAIRCPVMWAISETDLISMSTLNTVAAGFYAISSFCFGCVVNIVVSIGGSESQSEVGKFLLNRLSWFLVAFAVLFAVAGLLVGKKKASILDRIKAETNT
jgi:hypothetical protein